MSDADKPIEDLHTGEFLILKRRAHWEYVSRRRAAGAVSIVAITQDEELLLVEQFRFPVNCNVLELPAGVVGDEAAYQGESLESCAQRELIEEAGYQAGRFRLLMQGPSSPGLTSECSHIMLASDLDKVGEGGGVGGENITVHRAPLAGIQAWLENQESRGLLICPKIYTGLYFIQHRFSSDDVTE